MSKTQEWVVVTTAYRPTQDVTNDLRDAGRSIDELFEDVNCITGTAALDSVKKLRAIPGVVNVSVGLGNDKPPRSGMSW